MMVLVGLFSHFFLNTKRIWTFKVMWFPIGTVLIVAALTIALIKPYRKSYMAYLDCLLLTDLALLCYLMRSGIPAFLIVRILFYAPITTLILTVMLTKIWKVWKQHGPVIKPKYCLNSSSCKCCRLLLNRSHHQRTGSSVTIQSDDSEEEQLPPHQPLVSEIV